LKEHSWPLNLPYETEARLHGPTGGRGRLSVGTPGERTQREGRKREGKGKREKIEKWKGGKKDKVPYRYSFSPTSSPADNYSCMTIF